MIEMHYIFPTVVWKTHCALEENEKINLISYHDFLRVHTEAKNPNGNISWQSQDKFSEHDSFDPVKKIINENLSALQQNIFRNYDLSIQNIWFNTHETGSYNRLHAHGLCGLSGVYYLKCPEGSGKINFERNPFEKNIIEHLWFFCEQDFEARQIKFEITPKEGDLVFFPSWMPHWVDRSIIEENRISVAFNIDIILKN